MAQHLGGRKRIAIISGTVLSVVIGGAAFAFWTQTGAGTGTATTGTINPIVINQLSDNNTAKMWPGSGPVTLSGDYTNANDAKVYVHTISVVVDPAWTVAADPSKPACTAGDFTVSPAIVIDGEIDSGTNVQSWSGLTIQLDDLGTNQDNCKNVDPELLYTSN